ncbi:hypothetical protein BP6252_13344 [Coleophoma cylindrospora]|uniref:Oxidase ustYa n=1 Tax=Coleophoma cylindrospora TaxID=1849047 RepID=A0A3D8QB89_9HELO|nr:hypothetical protein BP6252_13344 [Coleophoma cylindrospora]
MDTKRAFRDEAGVEGREHLIAKPEAELSTINDEENWSPEISRPPRQSKSRTCLVVLKEYWWLYTTALLIALISLELVIWHDIRAGMQDCPQQAGGDYTNKGPIFTTEVTQWKANPDFVPLNATSFLDPRIQAKWETLYPPGAAFVGGPGSDDIYNSTSVTHQLHCVYIMGKIFSAVLTKSPNIPEPDDYEAYFLTCVDYIRQSVMCAGDVAIEPRGENGRPGTVNHENSFHGHHVCKDYGQVKDYLTGESSEKSSL